MKTIIWQITAIILSTAVIITIAAFMSPKVKATVEKKCIEVFYVDAKVTEVIGTIYNAVEGQCDADPLVTADNSKINLTVLKTGSLRWVALSRDLLKRWGGPYNYGDTIHVYHTDSRIRGKWVVHDTMNARFKKRMDFLVDVTHNRLFPHKSPHILISNTAFYTAR